jgi:WD40 repeat protein
MATIESGPSVTEIDPPEGLVYDGFISYSHAADDLLAPRLQAGLQRFAKPWWKRRALRIFRDEASLAANPHLWSSITDALDQSGWFILLLSPDAANSEWVNKETEYWLEHKDPNRIIPVVTDGEFGWSDGDIAGDSVPHALIGVFADEPRWVDLRFARTEEQLDLNNASFRAAVADVASAIRQAPKDELESEEVRQHRRTTRTAWAAGAVVVLLAVAAIVAAAFAVAQTNEAEAQRDEARRQTDIAQEQTRVAEEQTREAEEQRRQAETQTQIAQQERDRAELNAMETAATVLLTESERFRESEPAVTDLLAVEARRRIDIELTRANLARNILSASAVVSTQMPPSTRDQDVGPDGSWFVFTSESATGIAVQDLDLVAQRPGDRRVDLPDREFAEVDLSDDGSRFVVWYHQRGTRLAEATVFDSATFEQVGVRIPAPFSVMEISPDGSLLAVARTGGETLPGTVDLMTIDGDVVGSLPGDGDGQIDPGIQFSGDGTRLVAAQWSTSAAVVKVWDVAGETMLLSQSFGEDFYSGAPAISSDGRLVAVATGGDAASQGGAEGQRFPLKVIVLDVDTGAIVADIGLDTFHGTRLSVAFGAVEPVLAIGDSSGVSIVSTETFEVIRRIDHATGAECCLWLRDADSKLLAMGVSDRVTRFDLTVTGTSSVGLPTAGITALSPVGDTIAVVKVDGSLSFWSARTGEEVGSSDLLVLGTAELGRTHSSMAGIGGVPVFSSDGSRLYVRDRDGRFAVVEVSSGEVIAELDLPVGRTHNALAASGAFIATGHVDGSVMLWDAASFGTTDKPLSIWQLSEEAGECAIAGIRRLTIAESTSGLLLGVVDQCDNATRWEVVDDQPTKAATFGNSFTLESGLDDSSLVSQTGTRLRLLNDDGSEIRRFEAHREEVLDTSMSTDMGTMASVSRDAIGMWYTASGESLAAGITGAQAHIAGDGSFAVTSGAAAFDWFGGPVVVWDLDPEVWEEQACESAGRNLTFFEWNEFFPDDAYRVTCPQWPSGL